MQSKYVPRVNQNRWLGKVEIVWSVGGWKNLSSNPDLQNSCLILSRIFKLSGLQCFHLGKEHLPRGAGALADGNRVTRAMFVTALLFWFLCIYRLIDCCWIQKMHYHKTSWCLWCCKLGNIIYKLILTEYLMSWHLMSIIFFTNVLFLWLVLDNTANS